jgi:hypothetical protein
LGNITVIPHDAASHWSPETLSAGGLLRRVTQDLYGAGAAGGGAAAGKVSFSYFEAGAYTRPHFSST